MFDAVEIPVTTRITLPDVWAEPGDCGSHRIRARAGSQSFSEGCPADTEGMNALLSRLQDFLTRNAKVELLQG